MEAEIVAELASNWGWSESQVMGTAWYNVNRYLNIGRRQKAQDVLTNFGLHMQVSHGTESSVEEFVHKLREIIAGPLPKALKEAEILRRQAAIMAASGDEQQKTIAGNLAAHARFVEFQHRFGAKDN